MLLNIGGFAFHAIASRRLGVDDYGVLYALISICMIAGVPATLAQPVIARFAAEFGVLHDERHIRRLAIDVVRLFGMLAVLYVVAALIVMQPAANFEHVPPWTIPIAASIGGGILLSVALRAIAQGTQNYGGFARSCIADGATKVAAVFVLTMFVTGVLGGVLGFACGVFGGVIAVGLSLYERYKSVGECAISYDWRRIAVSGVGSAALTLAAALMSSADVVLVKHFFSADQAGIYSAASLGGKILLYFVGFVPTILLPQATQRFVRGERTRYALAACVAVLVVIGVVGLIALRFVGLFMLHALVGHAFDAAYVLLLPYSVAMVFLSISGVLATYGIATHRIAFAAPLLTGVCATLSSILFFHISLAQVVEVLVVGNAVTALAVAIAIVWQGIASQQRSPKSPA